jgi:hypothetical protein
VFSASPKFFTTSPIALDIVWRVLPPPASLSLPRREVRVFRDLLPVHSPAAHQDPDPGQPAENTGSGAGHHARRHGPG